MASCTSEEANDAGKCYLCLRSKLLPMSPVRTRRRSNKQLLLAARLMSVAARALRARAAICWKAPQQNCGR
jgi:hypothetical protein